jgi:transmembrane sensor
MTFEEALTMAGKIATGVYDQMELDQFLQFLDSARSAQVSQILEAYKESLDRQENYQLCVAPDFMDRMRALKPEVEHHLPETAFKETKGIGWFRKVTIVAAASLICVFGYFLIRNEIAKTDTLAKVEGPTDIKAPRSNRATITMGSGQTIFLDSASNGTLASQGNVEVRKLSDGQIAYSGTTTEITYNTLMNPRGSKPITITLSDGTKVWLNTGSSLTYPVAFIGKERNVEITGEAYFEVTHNPAMPFAVRKFHDDAKIQVLGTHFNVNAYDDESALKVTLLEGSVRVSKGNQNNLLKPGQQDQMTDGNIKLLKDIDIDEVMAWKNGKFQFGDATDITVIMRQISRWYDVDIEYQGNVRGSVWGSISRDVNVSQVLKMLETTGVVKCKMEGRKVTVMPAAP